MNKVSSIKYQVSSIFLAGIILLGFMVRFINVSNIPPGLTWDEAALGYNAYSILKTGRDEYGQFLPITLKSFGDYKPALYAYFDIPFVSILGLSELAVRLPSILSGVGLILLVYLLMNQLFEKRNLSLFAAISVAISPLAIQFSRAAFESNVAVFLNVLAVYLFIKSFKIKKLLVLSALTFGLSLLTYQASRFFVPVLVLGMVMIYWNQIKWDRLTIWSALVLAVFGLLIGISMFVFGQSARLETTSYFAYRRSDEQINQIVKEDGMDRKSVQFQILHGEWFTFTRGLFERYLIYFSPKMLSVDGDYSPRHRVPDLGMLYYFSVFFIPLGIIFIWRKGGNAAKIIFFWLAISPLPAVLSRDLINSVRALNLILPFAILEGAGIYYLISLAKKLSKISYYAVCVLIFLLIIANISVYLDRYFIHFPIEQSEGWLYGYKEALQSSDPEKFGNYNKVVITDTFGQPYIYYLFYTKYPPDKYQKQAELDQNTVDVGTVRKIDNIEFRHVFWPGDRGSKNSLFIGTTDELPDQDIKPFKEYKIVSDINFLDKLPAFRIVETSR